jgi:hypothetical protein
MAAAEMRMQQIREIGARLTHQTPLGMELLLQG